MTAAAAHIIEDFEALPEPEKREGWRRPSGCMSVYGSADFPEKGVVCRFGEHRYLTRLALGFFVMHS